MIKNRSKLAIAPRSPYITEIR